MVSNQLLNPDISWLLLEEAFHSLCLVLPEQGAALWFPLKPWRQAMPAPWGASRSARCTEAAGRPYRNMALFGAGHLQEHHQHPQILPRAAGWEPKQAASPPQPGAGGRWGCHVVQRCCAGGAVPAVPTAPGKHGVPLLLFSWGWFCFGPTGLGGGCGSWAPCPACLSWRSSAAAGALLGLAPSPAHGPRQQRVVALSEARGCKHFPALPSPN